MEGSRTALSLHLPKDTETGESGATDNREGIELTWIETRGENENGLMGLEIDLS